MKTNQMNLREKLVATQSSGSMLTVEEACAYLKVSKSFLYKATMERNIAFYKPTGGKLLRFHIEDLDRWLLQNRFDSKNEIEEQFRKGGVK